MSIQLALDGHSFSASEPIRDEGDLLVEILSPRTMLVPEELFDQVTAAAQLAANGMPPLAGECIVWSEACDGVVAIMAADASVILGISSEEGLRPHYTTPLLHAMQATTPTVWIYRTAGLLYIKVYDRSLRLAEVISAPTDADIRYFMESLGRIFPFGNYDLYIAGEGTKKIHKLLNGWFQRIITEKEK